MVEAILLASPYPRPEPNRGERLATPTRAERIGDDGFAEFVERQLGRVSETAPEAGAPCDGAVGSPRS